MWNRSNDFLQLQHSLYEALGIYHELFSRYWKAFAEQQPEQAQVTAQAIRLASADVQAALDAVLQHLGQLRQTEDVVAEIDRCVVIQDVLDIELNLLPSEQ